LTESFGFRFFVLGAGFSKPAGLPLGPELWHEVRRRVVLRSSPRSHFLADLETYLQYILECDGVELAEDDVDFEQFMAFLDLEFFLGLRGSDTFSDEGNETQIFVKKLIGEVITEATPARDSLPEFYYDFARDLGRGDFFLTFNYDTLLERALEHAGVPFRRFPYRYEEVHEMGGIIDSSRAEVTILKLHGSVDWFDRARYAESVEAWRRQGVSEPPDHLVFGPKSEFTVVPLLEGPQPPNDPLHTMYRVEEIETLYQDLFRSRAVPWLLSPSSFKVVYAEKLRDFWWGLGRSGGLNLGLAVIGYSLPEQDDYARQAIYSLTKNYQGYAWDEELAGQRKSPMLLIDRKEDPQRIESYRRRYGFVDSAKAKFHFSGFNEEAVQLIQSLHQPANNSLERTAGPADKAGAGDGTGSENAR